MNGSNDDDQRAPQDQLIQRGYPHSRPPQDFVGLQVTHMHSRKMYASRSPDAD